jgi:hypothetical protein
MIYDDTSYMLWNHNYQILTCKRAINSFCLNPHNVAMLIHNFCKSEGNQTATKKKFEAHSQWENR